MELKQYQENVLAALREFFTQARRIGHEAAFEKLTSSPEMQARLGKMRDVYNVWPSIADVPRICLKVPTGGGKTILAAHAIKIAAEAWMDVEFPMVIWFTPSDPIRKQTAAALRNPRHPYRSVLDDCFGGKVRVYDIDDKFNITPQDIRNNVCIIVSTVQSFKQSNTDKYNAYRHNENLESHFATLRVTDRMERREDGQVKFSFANLVQAHRPLMVMDEAHNAVTGLSEEMQARLYPSAIIELTATPRPRNNTLYSVYAEELRQEAMIKLPIDVVEHSDWSKCVTQSVVKRNALEQQCTLESKYIRPILLLQAEARNGENAVTSDAIKNYLIQDLSIPEEQIAIVTGEQHELDGVNVFDPECAVRYVITVQALKEGWDCSFAYILCSVANIKSKTCIEQLLGRVLRMPYASFRQTPALNKAYAFVRAQGFGEAAKQLAECLKNSGFDDAEAQAAIVEQKPVGDMPLFCDQYSVTFNPVGECCAEEEQAADAIKNSRNVPDSFIVEEQQGGAATLSFTQKTRQEDVDKLCRVLPPQQAERVQQTFQKYKELSPVIHTEPSPASRGQVFKIPQLMMMVQGELELADTDTLFEFTDWKLREWASPQLTPEEFAITQEGNAFRVDVNGERVSIQATTLEPYLPGLGKELWTEQQLTAWLVKKVQQQDISHSELLGWVSNAVHHLCVARALPMAGLVENRFRIMDKLIEHIKDGRSRALSSCNRLLFQDTPEVSVFTDMDKYTLELREDMFDDVPLYRGTYQFTKHFSGVNKVPAFDGKNGGTEGEEFQCAQIIDSLPQVSTWVRNVAKGRDFFSLPLTHNRFYPDFVAILEDGRTLVVEYKGGHLVTNEDTAEKANIGALWARKSNNLFLMAEKKKDNLDVRQQLLRLIG